MLAIKYALGRRSIGSVYSPAFRRYHGDPGPQTSEHRKSQRHRLRDASLGNEGRAIDADGLKSIMDAGITTDMAPRKKYRLAADREPRRPRGPVLPGRDGELRRDRPARVWDFAEKKWKFAAEIGGGDRAGDKDVAGGVGITGPREAFASQGYLPQRNSDQGSANGNRSKDDPYHTSALIKEYVQARPSPLNDGQVEAVLKIMRDAPKSAVNVVVWNQVLSLLGREGRLERMWRAYNDMKKIGIRPTAHTYTILLNRYAGLSHSQSQSPSARYTLSTPPQTHLSRTFIIWRQAQSLLSNLSSSASGLGASEEDTDATEQGRVTGPINAYLKFLARYGMWAEMWKVYSEARAKGQPFDRIGYTTLFTALLHLARKQVTESRLGADKKEMVRIGQMAREIWDDSLGDLGAKKMDDGGLDNRFVGKAVATLLLGRPADQRYAMSLIPEIWGLEQLPLPAGTAVQAEPEASTSVRLPQLAIDIPTSTTLLYSLIAASRPTLASHYANVMLGRYKLREQGDPPFWAACAASFAGTGDIAAVLDMLQKYAHRAPTGGFRRGFWLDCLTAARWAKVDGGGPSKGDWEGTKAVLSYMGIVPKVLSQVDEEAEDWKRPRKAQHFINPEVVQLEPKAMVIMLRTALGRGKVEVIEALSILDRCGLEESLQEGLKVLKGHTIGRKQESLGGPGSPRRLEWKMDLARATDLALQGLTDREAAECCNVQTRSLAGSLVDNINRHENNSDKIEFAPVAEHTGQRGGGTQTRSMEGGGGRSRAPGNAPASRMGPFREEGRTQSQSRAPPSERGGRRAGAQGRDGESEEGVEDRRARPSFDRKGGSRAFRGSSQSSREPDYIPWRKAEGEGSDRP